MNVNCGNGCQSNCRSNRIAMLPKSSDVKGYPEIRMV